MANRNEMKQVYLKSSWNFELEGNTTATLRISKLWDNIFTGTTNMDKEATQVYSDYFFKPD